jgi:hypothetical protein
MSTELEVNHFFQVMGDIDISGRTPVEKAFRPSLIFLQGNLHKGLINELILNLSLDQEYQLKIPLTEEYALKTGYGEYVVEYNKLKRTKFSDHTLKINTPELLVSLSQSKGQAINNDIAKDNTEFLIDLFEFTLKTIKDKNE